MGTNKKTGHEVNINELSLLTGLLSEQLNLVVEQFGLSLTDEFDGDVHEVVCDYSVQIRKLAENIVDAMRDARND